VIGLAIATWGLVREREARKRAVPPSSSRSVSASRPRPTSRRPGPKPPRAGKSRNSLKHGLQGPARKSPKAATRRSSKNSQSHGRTHRGRAHQSANRRGVPPGKGRQGWTEILAKNIERCPGAQQPGPRVDRQGICSKPSPCTARHSRFGARRWATNTWPLRILYLNWGFSSTSAAIWPRRTTLRECLDVDEKAAAQRGCGSRTSLFRTGEGAHRRRKNDEAKAFFDETQPLRKDIK